MIRLEDVTKIYRMGEVEVGALQGVSLEIDEGEIVAIMGPSGSGKSTLMNVIGCLDVPTAGRYVLTARTSARCRTTVCPKFGAADRIRVPDLQPAASSHGTRHVELPLMYGHGSTAGGALWRRSTAWGWETAPVTGPPQRSGGQQQRVGIARALVKQPRILLADEPTGNLDSQSSKEIMTILKSLNEDAGLTVILVTHERDIAAQAKHVVSMLDGRVITDRSVNGEGAS